MEWVVIGLKIGIGLLLAILGIFAIVILMTAIISLFVDGLEDLNCGWFIGTVLICLVVLAILGAVLF